MLKKKNTQLNAGFSVIEFIVIITIFGIMSSVIFFDFNGFSRRIDKDNLAADIALAYRQMQVFGISATDQRIGDADFSSAEISSVLSADLTNSDARYGVEISFPNQTIIQFQKGENTSSNYVGSDILVDILEITGTSSILKVCATSDGTMPAIDGNGNCDFGASPNGEEVNTGWVATTFKRPYPDAIIRGNNFSGGFIPTKILIMIGVEGEDPQRSSYVYVDSIGLIQVIDPEITS